MRRMAKLHDGNCCAPTSARRLAFESLESRHLLAMLVAGWNFDAASAPYVDQSGYGTPLVLDGGTSAPQATVGVAGGSVRLMPQSGPQLATRLSAQASQLETDSFGFSFWVRPVDLAPFQNLLGKQIQATAVGPEFSRLSWQVQIAGDNGTGGAVVEVVVRGSDRAQGDFFASVSSPVTLPLHAASSQWYHIAGGYDATTGQVALFVNNVAFSSVGRAGADNSDGGAISVGTLRNGASVVAAAAAAMFDEVQLYDGPITVEDCAYLYAHADRRAPVTVPQSPAATLVAAWNLNQAGPTFADASGNGNPLTTDSAAAAPLPGEGVAASGVALNWQANPGVATRLYAAGAALETDSFGFSFWINPTRLAPFENLIAKEVHPLAAEAFERIAWQVQVGQDNGAGQAPLQLIVRGSDRSQGNFFGSVYSAGLLSLYTDTSAWLHVAGGYDAASGALSLYLDAVPSFTYGRPGADNSDGSWFSVGSVRNGLDFVAFAAIAAIDEVRLYDYPLSAFDVASLAAFPSRTTLSRPQITSFLPQPNGDVRLTFDSLDGWYYAISASTDGALFARVLVAPGVGTATTVTLTASQLNYLVGVVPRQGANFRATPILADPLDGTLQLPARPIVKFATTERYVPQYHFSTAFAGTGVGDPDGVFRYQNNYRLFTWDQAISPDLVSGWTRNGFPFVGTPAGSSYWTGTVVVDKQNVSGFGSLATPPMIALYTIHNNTTGQESIGMAYSTDYRNFFQYAGNPVVQSPGDVEFRDPDVVWDAQSGRWIMVVARPAAHDVRFYASTDLRSWQYLSSFGNVGSTTALWETPGLAQVPIEGTDNYKWVLHVATAGNVQYFVGNWDGNQFALDAQQPPAWADFGSDFYAARVVRDYDGQSQGVQWLGWIGNWQYEANRPRPATWGHGAETLPRSIRLRPMANGYTLVQEPIAAVQKLRGPQVQVAPRIVQGTMNLSEFQPRTNTYEIQATFNLTDAGQKFGLNLCVAGNNKVVVGYDATTGRVFLDRTMSGNVAFSPAFANVTTAPIDGASGSVQFRIFVDQASIEVFVNGGERVLTSQIYPDTSSLGVQLFASGGIATLTGLQAWPLASVWTDAPGIVSASQSPVMANNLQAKAIDAAIAMRGDGAPTRYDQVLAHRPTPYYLATASRLAAASYLAPAPIMTQPFAPISKVSRPNRPQSVRSVTELIFAAGKFDW